MRGQGMDHDKSHGNEGFRGQADGSRGQMRGLHQGYISTLTTEASLEVTNARASGAAGGLATIVLPPGTDLAMWDMFVEHWQEKRRWSISRAKQCAGHLRLIAEAGGDPTAVLDWALSRHLADLRDAHRRMQRDAAREAMADRREGESLANRAVRQVRDRCGYGLRVIAGGAALEDRNDG